MAAQKGVFRTYEAVTDPVSGAPRWLPNSNMLFGYDSIGVYSPLASQAYRDYLGDLGDADDATGARTASVESIEKNIDRLNLLNVRYVISRVSLEAVPGLMPVFVSANKDRIYENTGFLPRAFLTDAIEKNGEGREVRWVAPPRVSGGQIEWIEEKPEAMRLQVDAPRDGFLFLSERHDPGWKVRVDGAPACLYKVDGLFQAIEMPKGRHNVDFRYDPLSYRIGLLISLAGLVAASFLWARREREPLL